METAKCKNCSSKFSRLDNLRRHEKTCLVQNTSKTVMETSVMYNCDAKTNNDVATLGNPRNKDDLASKKDDSKWIGVIDAIINKSPDDENNNLIQPLKSVPIDQVEDNSTKIPDEIETISEILLPQQRVKKRNISQPGSDNESSKDASIVKYRPIKKQKVNSTDDDSLRRLENSKPSLINELNDLSFESKKMDTRKLQIDESGENKDDEPVGDAIEDDTTQDEIDNQSNIQEDKNDENEDASGDDLDDPDENVLERGEGESVDEDDSEDDNDSSNISKEELKARLYRSGDNMKLFELNLDADEGLTNIDLFKYIDVLKVPKFRGVFMRDELPEQVNPVECGIVNLSPHKQLGTHWVCYAKIHNTRVYFDSFGRKTPLELQKYLKTAKEFRNNLPAVWTSTDVVQSSDTKICGHLCLFVLTSLMREHLTFQHVMDQLNYGYSHHYW